MKNMGAADETLAATPSGRRALPDSIFGRAGRDEEAIRDDIRNQEKEDRRLSSRICGVEQPPKGGALKPGPPQRPYPAALSGSHP